MRKHAEFAMYRLVPKSKPQVFVASSSNRPDGFSKLFHWNIGTELANTFVSYSLWMDDSVVFTLVDMVRTQNTA